ncbi:MAG: hypothetical protein MUC36_28210 [Planctomycetes bacterium]|nr:hypothetical protein [Planctomycetota bacterium]
MALFGELRDRLASDHVIDDGAARAASVAALLDQLASLAPLPARLGWVGMGVSARRLADHRLPPMQRLGPRLALVPDAAIELLLCVEHAQTIEPDSSAALVAELCRLAPCVVFSAALPRQPGFGHINARSHRYWIDRFAQHGFVCLDGFRQALWASTRVEPAVRQNAYLFVDQPLRQRYAGWLPPTLVDGSHPLLITDSVLAEMDPQQAAVAESPATAARRSAPASEPATAARSFSVPA